LTDLDKKFGRYTQSSSEFLFEKISLMKSEEILKIIQADLHSKMTSFLFCIFATFRYSAVFFLQEIMLFIFHRD